MKTSIAEIKKLAPGTEVRGFPLLVKTARRAFEDSAKLIWQEVVFMDVSGEMIGHVLLPRIETHDRRTGGYTAWKSKTNLCIMQATVQAIEGRNGDVKLSVTDCFDTATPLTWDQQEELSSEDWQRLHDEEISGKIRHGLTIAWVQATKRLTVTDVEKNLINCLVDFIKKG